MRDHGKNFSKIVTLILLFSIIGGGFLLVGNKSVHADSTNYDHNHNGYKCYKITSYMPASEVKTISEQADSIVTASDWAAALGGTYKSWIGALAFIYGQNVKAQMTPFINAAKKGKGVGHTYYYHDSLLSTASYSDGDKFVEK